MPGPTTFPQELVTTMIYSQTKQIAAPAGVGVTAVFRGNSIFDPDQGAVTTNSLWLSTVDDIYSAYAVTGSRIEVDFINSELVPIKVFVYPYQSSNLTDVDFSINDAMPHNKRAIVPLSSGGGIRKVVNYMRTFDMLNKDPRVDDNVQSLIAANPSDQWFWHVNGRPVDEATTGAFTIIVKIIYYVIFSKRKNIGYTAS